MASTRHFDHTDPTTGVSSAVGLPAGTCSLQFTRISDAPFGMEVTGLSWGHPDPDTCKIIGAALRSNLLLVLRPDRSPSESELDDFLRGLGRLVLETEDGREHYKGHVFKDGGPESALKREMRSYQHRAEDNTGSTFYDPMATGASELVWHNDQSHRPMLKVISVLEAVDFDEVTVPTQFRDTYVAAETLPRETRAAIADRQGIYFDPRMPPPGELPRAADAMHPLLLGHPHSARRALYVNDYVNRVAGMDRSESDQLLRSLRRHLASNAPSYDHHWRSGDIVIWDNVGLQHRRDPIPVGQRRHMRQHGGVAE
jgi:alpha-ketoglutarate-dependent taurine dioxygenase